jgi:MoaA/NifB/PqqE/SkfB family radical SAM enzyme
MQLQGGEPFISPNFEEVIDLVEEQIDLKDVHLYITTNGSTIPSDDIVNKLREFKLIDLSVSIDSSHKVNQYIRHGNHDSLSTLIRGQTLS